MKSLPAYLIVFDGVCVLCNRFTNYVIKHDQAELFYFTSYQKLLEMSSDTPISGLPAHLDKSITYYRNEKFYQGSKAVLYIFKDLFGWFHWSQLGWLLPRFLRDFFYSRLANKRYTWFGRLASCPIPAPEIQHRFL